MQAEKASAWLAPAPAGPGLGSRRAASASGRPAGPAETAPSPDRCSPRAAPVRSGREARLAVLPHARGEPRHLLDAATRHRDRAGATACRGARDCAPRLLRCTRAACLAELVPWRSSRGSPLRGLRPAAAPGRGEAECRCAGGKPDACTALKGCGAPSSLAELDSRPDLRLQRLAALEGALEGRRVRVELPMLPRGTVPVRSGRGSPGRRSCACRRRSQHRLCRFGPLRRGQRRRAAAGKDLAAGLHRRLELRRARVDVSAERHPGRWSARPGAAVPPTEAEKPWEVKQAARAALHGLSTSRPAPDVEVAPNDGRGRRPEARDGGRLRAAAARGKEHRAPSGGS